MPLTSENEVKKPHLTAWNRREIELAKKAKRRAGRATPEKIVDYINARAVWDVQQFQYDFIERGILAKGKQLLGLSCARSGGKSSFIAAIVCCFIDPKGPLFRGGRDSLVFVSCPSTEQGSVILYEVAYLLGADTGKHHGFDLNGWKMNRGQGNFSIENKCGSKVHIMGSRSKAAHGRKAVLWLGDEPAQWSKSASAIFSAAVTTLGKQGPEDKLVMIGTRADNSEHFYEQLLFSKDPSTFSMVYKASVRKGADDWRSANPLIHLNIPDVSIVENELRRGKLSPAAMASFLSLRCNMGISDTIQDADLLCSVEEWEGLDARPNEVPEGQLLVLGVDTGQASSFTSVCGIFEGGDICIQTFCGDTPTLQEKEAEDGAQGIYFRAVENGELEVIRGLRVPPVSYVVNWVLEHWGTPEVLITDWHNKSIQADAYSAAKLLPIVEFRNRSGTSVHDDIASLRSAITLQLFERPDSILLDCAISRLCVKETSGGNHHFVKAYGNGYRDDPGQALALAWHGMERLGEREPLEPPEFFIGKPQL